MDSKAVWNQTVEIIVSKAQRLEGCGETKRWRNFASKLVEGQLDESKSRRGAPAVGEGAVKVVAGELQRLEVL